MRLRKNQAVAFGANVARACAARVCQPLPLDRQAASTSGSRRKVTGALCSACTGRPPERRAMICSGVCTRPSPPATCCSPRSIEASKAAVSASSWVVVSDTVFLHQGAQQVRRKAFNTALGIDRYQHQFTACIAHKVNHPCTATLAHASAAPAYFAQTTRAGNHVARLRVGRNPVNECMALIGAPHLGSAIHELGAFDDGKHGFIVHLITCIASQIKPQAGVPVDGDPRANPAAALRQITHPRPSEGSAVYQVSK